VARIPASGRQYAIGHRDQEAVITEVGGGLRSYTIGGHDVIDGYAEDELRTFGRGMPLLPWPNRIADGRYEFMGRTYQTALTEPRRRNAIHGLTQWLSWQASNQDADRVTMSLLLHPQEGYPFALSLAIDYGLSDTGLTVQTTATNLGEQPCPYGAGQHPYLTLGTERIDSAWLRLPALLRMELDERLIPTGRLIRTEGTEFDFLEGRPIGATKLDTAFTSLVPEADGITRIRLQAPGAERRLTLWMDASYQYVMLFSGDTIPDESRQRRSIAIEPMTCAPNAFQNRLGLIVLEPAKSMTSRWGLAATE
jgi:aldose 1-epimerase